MDLRQLGRGKPDTSLLLFTSDYSLPWLRLREKTDTEVALYAALNMHYKSAKSRILHALHKADLFSSEKNSASVSSSHSNPFVKQNLSSCCPQCTKPCGGGIKTRLVVCQRPNGERFNDLSCEIHDKPPDREQCNTQPCPSSPHWSTDPWSSVRS